MVTAYERHGFVSSEGSHPATTRQYVIEGTADETVAKAALILQSPATYGALVRKSYSVELQGVDWWHGSVEYGERDRLDTGESEYQFDTGGGTQHIMTDLARTRYGPNGVNDAPDSHGLIGGSKDGPEGVDIAMPVYKWTETHMLPIAVVTTAYRLVLAGLTGRINDAVFRDMAVGTVLFEGASGSQRGEEDWQIQYRFAFSPDVTDLAIDDITVATKPGWSYLWIRYNEIVDGTTNDKTFEPLAAYVSKVYRDGDFTLMGIG